MGPQKTSIGRGTGEWDRDGKANKGVFSSHHWVTGDWSLPLQGAISVRHAPQSHLLEGEELGMCAHPPVSHWLRAAPGACAGWALGAREALGQRQAMVSSWRWVGPPEWQCERGRRKQPVPATALARVQEALQMSPLPPQTGVDGEDLHPGFICPIRIGSQHMALVSCLCQSRS